jgi:MFS transporter, DHA1 family, tetracycline resistance protein
MISNLNFFIVLLIGFVDYLGIGLVYPVFAALLFDMQDPIIPTSSSLAYRGAMLGILIGLTPIAQFFTSPILGVLSDLKGRKCTLIFGIVLGWIGYFFAVIGIFNHSLLLLFFYRILVGISGGTVAVAQAVIADISTQETKTRRFALFNASIGLGFTVGPFLGGKLSDPSFASWTGYAAPFIAANVMCFINLAMVLWRFPETRLVNRVSTMNVMQGITNIRKVFLWPKLRWIFFAAFAFSFGWSFFNEFIPLLLRKLFDFTSGDIGNYYAYGGGWYAFCASIAAVPLLKYLAAEKVVVKALIGNAVCMLGFLVIRDSYYIWWILPIFMFWMSVTYPTMTVIVSNHANNENQGEILGVYHSVIAFAMGLSPLLAGPAIGVYPELTAWGGALMMLIACLAFWMGCRRVPSIMELVKE